MSMANIFTIHLDHAQKEIVIKALEKYSQMTLGQTSVEFDAAKKIAASIQRSRHQPTINLVADK